MTKKPEPTTDLRMTYMGRRLSSDGRILHVFKHGRDECKYFGIVGCIIGHIYKGQGGKGPNGETQKRMYKKARATWTSGSLGRRNREVGGGRPDRQTLARRRERSSPDARGQEAQPCRRPHRADREAPELLRPGSLRESRGCQGPRESQEAMTPELRQLFLTLRALQRRFRLLGLALEFRVRPSRPWRF